MYLHNKYTKWYNNIISRAQSRVLSGYSERHHIVPKCLGGSDDDSNLVRLTAREHFICHQLLVKMVEQGQRGKLSLAAAAMWRRAKNQSRDYVFHSRTYDTLKTQASTYLSELNKKKWAAARDGTGPAMGSQKGKPHAVKRTEEHKQKLREAALRNKEKQQGVQGANLTNLAV